MDKSKTDREEYIEGGPACWCRKISPGGVGETKKGADINLVEEYRCIKCESAERWDNLNVFEKKKLRAYHKYIMAGDPRSHELAVWALENDFDPSDVPEEFL